MGDFNPPFYLNKHMETETAIDIDIEKTPRHIAIIMDGNGRWAKQRGLSRSQGHIEGVRRVEELIDYAPQINVKVITLFTFSTENWSRPENEVSMLMNILVAVLNRKTKKLMKNNIRFQTVGREEKIPQELLNTLRNVEQQTSSNTGLIMNLAFNYGGRLEIIDAIKGICREVKNGNIEIENIDEKLVSDNLYTKNLPDPDLLIRTSGEQRISNFLLWQLSYAEFFFSDKFWPDFTMDEFKKAIIDYQNRNRRYGKV